MPKTIRMKLEDVDENYGYVRVVIDDVLLGKLDIDVRIKVDDKCLSIDVYNNGEGYIDSRGEFYVPYEDLIDEEE